LARAGYKVTGVDASPGLLARFERDLAAEPAGVRARVRVEHGLIEDYAERSWVHGAGVVGHAAGLAGDWAACGQAFGSVGYVNRIGVSARANRLAGLTARLAGRGLEVTAWYRVRVFTDTADEDAESPPDLAALLDCEERAGRTDPYRQVAALLHLVARRPG
jgi:S-adenosylmethionine-dependent methyltransferase